MPEFEYAFKVNAPRDAVIAFHHDSSVLKKLSPPPIFVQLHLFDPLADGAVAEFTMWFGPFPARWQAVHSDVGVDGFTDTQVKGPLRHWRHRHGFQQLSNNLTRISESIVYEHPAGLSGLLTRLVFNRPGLTFLFAYRQLVTRLALEPDFRRQLGRVASLAAGVALGGLLLFQRRRNR